MEKMGGRGNYIERHVGMMHGGMCGEVSAQMLPPLNSLA